MYSLYFKFLFVGRLKHYLSITFVSLTSMPCLQLRADVNPTLAGTGECVQKPLKLTLVHAWPVSWAKTVNVSK